MYYLKIWHEARNDAKLRALSDAQFRVWFNLLLFASEQAIRGNIEFESEELLAVEVAKGDVHLLGETVKRLETLHIVSLRFIPPQNGPVSGPDETQVKRLAFLHFEKRQESGDRWNALTSTHRVRKHRDKQRLGRHETNETQMKRDVTPVKRDVTRGNEVKRQELELELELEPDSPPCMAPPALPSNGTHTRTGDDLESVNRAIALLGSDLTTEPLGLHLGRVHNSTGHLGIAGWKWLRAAERIQGPSCTDGQRRSFAYFAKIAANLQDSEREERPAAKRETKAEKRDREFKEGCQRMKEKALKEREHAG